MSYPPISETALNTIIKANAYEPYYSFKSSLDLYDMMFNYYSQSYLKSNHTHY